MRLYCEICNGNHWRQNCPTKRKPMSKVSILPQFNGQFPEQFNWGLVDSHTLSALGENLTREAKEQLQKPPEERYLLPGIRFALNCIAERALVGMEPLIK